MASTSSQADPLEVIPPAHVVRSRLAECLRQTKLLRQMLKLAEQAERDKATPKPKAAGDDRAGG